LQPRKALTACLLWMADQVLRPGQSYIMKLGTAEVNADVVALRHAVDIHSFHDHPTEALAMNGIGVVDLAFDRAIIATAYATDRELGSLILIDRMTNQTVALGIVQDELSTFANRTGQPAAAKRTVLRLVGPAGSPQRWRFWTRVARKTIEACVLWFVVATLAQNGWLALAVAFADLLMRPVADRLAAWAGTGCSLGILTRIRAAARINPLRRLRTEPAGRYGPRA
jgi:hypothetical protein